MLCSNCEEGVIGVFDQPGPSKHGRPMNCPANPTDSGFNLVRTYPQPATAKAPTHTTPQLARFYQQAAAARARGDFDASGAMSRKVIDVSTKQKLGEDAKKFGTLQKRIDELASRGDLTKDLAQWAHQIRLDGNDAAHDEDPFTENEADDLLGFVDLYLTYVYSLPGRLADRKSASATTAPAPTAP